MKRKTFIISLCILILIIPRIYPQSIKTTVLPAASCPGAYTVAIGVENCYNIGAISLKLNYDAQNVTYVGYQNFNTILSDGFTFINAANGQVIISWASVHADSIGTGTLVELRFSSGTGTFPFQWSTGVSGDCEYADTNGVILPSAYVNGSATIYQLPSITQQPVSKTTYVGNSISFYAGATGMGVNYLWQISTNGGNDWSDLTNTPPYSGTTSSTLNIFSATLGLSGNMYRCRINGTCPFALTTNTAQLLVYQVINMTASTLNPCAGTVIAPITVQNCNGVGAISLKLNYNTSLLVYGGYQHVNTAFPEGSYYISENHGEITFSWANIDPANLGTGTLFELVFNSIVGSAYLNWNNQVTGNCEFSDIYGNLINSTYANGTINTLPPPAMTAHPANRSILAGQNTTFSVAATGSGLGYQWEISTNGGGSWSTLSSETPYSGVTSETLSITGASQGMNGNRYRCTVSGTCPPAVTSHQAALTVTTAPTPVATSIGSVSGVCTGNVSIPVTVSNCNNIGAISLVLLYDTTKLTYAGYHSVNPELSKGFYYVNRSGNQVTLSCASNDPLNIGSGTLLYYRFIANAGISASLVWDTQTSGNCEYSDINATLLATTFTNGTVTIPSNALVVKAGNDVSTPSGVPVQLNALVSGGITPLGYAWTPTAGLNNAGILNPTASPSETTTYRLTVTGGNSCVAWDEVVVTVNSSIPAILTLESTTVASGSNMCFNATQTVTVAGDGKQFLVQSGGHANIIAGQNVFLKEGTTVESSGTLHVSITSDGTYCGNQKSFLASADEEPYVEIPSARAETGSSNVKIYPNPTAGIFTLETGTRSSESPVFVKIYNLTGAEVINKQVTGARKSTFSLENMVPGIYLVSVLQDGIIKTVKIILQ